MLLDKTLSHWPRYDNDLADYAADGDDDDNFIPRGHPVKPTGIGNQTNKKNTPQKVLPQAPTAKALATTGSTNVGPVSPEASDFH